MFHSSIFTKKNDDNNISHQNHDSRLRTISTDQLLFAANWWANLLEFQIGNDVHEVDEVAKNYMIKILKDDFKSALFRMLAFHAKNSDIKQINLQVDSNKMDSILAAVFKVKNAGILPSYASMTIYDDGRITATTSASCDHHERPTVFHEQRAQTIQTSFKSQIQLKF